MSCEQTEALGVRACVQDRAQNLPRQVTGQMDTNKAWIYPWKLNTCQRC